MHVKDKGGLVWHMKPKHVRLMDSSKLKLRLAELELARASFNEAEERWKASRETVWRDSMIKRFEYTFELCWKAAKDWIEVFERDLRPDGPRQVLEAAFSRDLIRDASGWTQLLEARNKSVHVYGIKRIVPLAELIETTARPLFDDLVERLHESA